MGSSTPDLCDQHAERIRICAPLLRSFGGRGYFAGRITTIRCFEDNSRVRDLVAEHGEGRVLVVDGGGSLRRALLGDQLARQAAANGWQGMVINGCVRDVEVLAQIDLGVQALAAHPMKTEKRGVGEVDVPVAFADVDFMPGHWLYADANGVIVADDELTA